MQRELANQYRLALTMLRGVVAETDERTWLAADERQSAAWHIAYHTVYYANIYASPSEAAVRRWPGQSDNAHFLGPTPWPPHERCVPAEVCSQARIAEFIDFVLAAIPDYLAQMEPDAPCWPHWYQQNQCEFHLNNLRHIQHHTGQLIERNGGTAVGWPGVGG
jgi:hypothetical protein